MERKRKKEKKEKAEEMFGDHPACSGFFHLFGGLAVITALITRGERRSKWRRRKK